MIIKTEEDITARKRAPVTNKLRRIVMPIEERINRSMTKTDTCWIWNAQMHHNRPLIYTGPGVVETNVYRYLWEKKNGKLYGANLKRQCNEARCVNPDHFLRGGNKLDPIK